ncbi:MAG: aspartate aminotransferase family protein [Myxococcales bacterium]|nr:aspartate aminotransferase family protein [Myxococcales bacterium]
MVKELLSGAWERHEKFINPKFVQRLRTLGYARLFPTARGVELEDAEGRRYLDLIAGFGSVNLGFNHPELVAEIARTLAASPPSFLHFAPNLEAGRLAEALAARLGPSLSMAFFANSGAEAVEGALKLAFAATRRARVLYCAGGYHGLTLGALSAMGAERLRAPFPSLPGFEAVAFGGAPDQRGGIADKLRTKRYAAFLVEPIQIEGGVKMPKVGWLSEIAALCRATGTALILDEIQTGIGRTGDLFAYQSMGFVPDILVYAKALSGGLIPIGGYSTSPEWWKRAYPRGEDFDLHSTTFGGNTLACAVARRTLELCDEALLARVRTVGDRLGERLRTLAANSPLIAEVRGTGLIWGIALAPPTSGALTALTLGIPNAIAARLLAHWVAVRLLERGFITETTTHDETVLRVEPALIIEEEQLARFVDALDETLLENERFTSFVASAGARLIGNAAARALRTTPP